MKEVWGVVEGKKRNPQKVFFPFVVQVLNKHTDILIDCVSVFSTRQFRHLLLNSGSV